MSSQLEGGQVQPRLLPGLVLWLMLSMVAQAATITVGSNGFDFTSIQAAIDVADPGDKILVYSGTYYENVDVNIPIILRGVDTGSGRPLVDAGRNGTAIILSADGCTLEGFEVRNSNTYGVGIGVVSDNNFVIYNLASNNYDGIYLGHSSNNIVKNNIVVNNQQRGIHLYRSDSNMITANVVSNNYDGIYLYESTNNTIKENHAVGNRLSGIRLRHSISNKIISNEAFDNRRAIFLSQSYNNTMMGNNPTEFWLDHFSGGSNTILDSMYSIEFVGDSLVHQEIAIEYISIIETYNFTIDFAEMHVYSSASVYIDVKIESMPPGAQIWVDGKNTGKLSSTKNCALYYSKPGNYTCELRLDGYEILPITISIPGSGSRIINVTLTKIDENKDS